MGTRLVLLRKVSCPLVLLIVLLVGFAADAMEDSPASSSNAASLPFAPGEKLTYDVQYLGTSMGVSVLAVLDAITQNGQVVYPLLSTAQSSDFASIFYRVNDRIESFLNPKGLYSHAIRVKQHERKRKKEKQITFDQMKHQATLTENGQQEVFDIPPKVNDSLSALYVMRTFHPLTVGKTLSIDIHEGRKNLKLAISVLAKETVTTPIGTFDTLKMQAVPHHEGIPTGKGVLTVWVTDDDKKVPVQIRSKAKFGAILMVLISRRDG